VPQGGHLLFEIVNRLSRREGQKLSLLFARGASPISLRFKYPIFIFAQPIRVAPTSRQVIEVPNYFLDFFKKVCYNRTENTVLGCAQDLQITGVLRAN
jgi:hypothetical protein